MVAKASRADAVARTKPINDEIAGTVFGFGRVTHRTQPQIKIAGGAIIPRTIRTPKNPCMAMLNAKISSYTLYPRSPAA